MSNSTAHNRSGREVTEPRTAIAGIGDNIVRSAAISFAWAQIRPSCAHRGLEKPLEEMWRSSTCVAALRYVLAENRTGRNVGETSSPARRTASVAGTS